MKKIRMAFHRRKVLKENFASCDVGIVMKEKTNGCLDIQRLETLNKAWKMVIGVCNGEQLPLESSYCWQVKK